ncbi:MAG: hypothetical protein K6F09_02295, partial [Clostridiales bacterium]|nr:hypothetical protein [Clostridiales bacterium]
MSVSPYIRIIERLRRVGIPCELVIGYREGGEYGTPFFSAISKCVEKEISSPSDMSQAGIYLVNLSLFGASETAFLRAASVYDASENENVERETDEHWKIMRPISFRPTRTKEDTAENVSVYTFTDMSVRVGENGIKPYRPWCFILSGISFGTLVSDKSLGFTWAINSRENKLTPWSNDERTDNDGEALILDFKGQKYNMTLNSEAEFSPESAKWCGNAGELEYEITVTVPERGMVKMCSVKIRNKSHRQAGAGVIYYAEPVLGVDRTYQRFIKAEKIPDGVVMCSSFGETAGYSALTVAGGADFISVDRDAFICGVEERNAPAELLKAVDETAWYGDRYARAFFDDGTPLGVRGCGECELDSLAQSFAVLSGMPDKSRLNKAADSVLRELLDEKNGILKLLSPPFNGGGADAGYITSYPPGIRENGGQYTHAAVWFCMALFKLGREEEGAKLLKMLNPLVSLSGDAENDMYKTEPYAVPA